MQEELAIELEALQFTYGDQFEPSVGDDGSYLLRIHPRGTEEEWERYVKACLRLSVPASYPENLPSVELVDVKGLADEQVAECLASIQHEAESLHGEMMLGHLCETAIEYLTAANHPPGDCVFCLQPVVAAGTPAGAIPSPAYDVLKLGCYHCFHLPCFGPWWHWQQRQLAQREAQLQDEYKAMAVSKLREEEIERDEQGVFTVRCPACRAPVPPASLAHAQEALQGTSADAWTQQGRRQPLGLDPESARRLQQLQRRHAAVLARQQRAGGLIDHEKGVAVSVAELQLAADTSRQAAAGAATCAAAAAASAAAAAALRQSKPGRQGRDAGVEQPGSQGVGRAEAGEGRRRHRGPRRRREVQLGQQEQPQQLLLREDRQEQQDATPGRVLAELPPSQPGRRQQPQQQAPAPAGRGGGRGRSRPGPAAGPGVQVRAPAAPGPGNPSACNTATGGGSHTHHQARRQQQQQQQQQHSQPEASRPRHSGSSAGGQKAAQGSTSGGRDGREALSPRGGPPDKDGLRVQEHPGGRGRGRMPLQQPRG